MVAIAARLSNNKASGQNAIPANLTVRLCHGSQVGLDHIGEAKITLSVFRRRNNLKSSRNNTHEAI